MSRLDALVAKGMRGERRQLRRAMLLGVLVAASSVALLGVSGWFITAAAFAGAAGAATALAFNYMLPSAVIRLLAIVRTGARYGEALASHAAALGMAAGIRVAAFRGIAALPVRHALGVASGDATARIVNDLDAIEQGAVRRSAGAAAAAALASGVALALLGGLSAALLLAAIFLAALVGAKYLAQGLHRPAHRLQEANAALKERLVGLVEAAPELRCYGLEQEALADIGLHAAAMEAAQIASADIRAKLSLLQSGVIAIAAASIFALSAGAGAPLAALAALAAAMTLDGAAPLLRRIAAAPQERSAGARIEALLGEPAAASVPAPAQAAPALALARTAAPPMANRIALPGRSGSGKTSLIEMLVGLRPALPASAWLEGIDIAFLPSETLRAAFAWAPQDAMLIAGTVRDNLQLAAPDAHDDMLWQALSDAAIDARVRALPHGLDSWIGENGERLSGGERRRIALARAYLRPAPWLLLDEPTESLDEATEQEVVERLEARLRRTGQGLVLASHRPLPHRLCVPEHRLERA